MPTDLQGKKSFYGGVHPPENKNLTAENAIKPGPGIKQIAVMLSQHIGAPAQPTVAKGYIVKIGQQIGQCNSFVCAPIHSPVTGTVKDIRLESHPILERALALIIEAYPDTEIKEPTTVLPENFSIANYTSEQIRDAVASAGIIGMGGAGFPTRVKLEPDPNTPKQVLIINSCECEPYITSDYRIMLEWTERIVAGIRLAQKASGCETVYIAVEDNKPEAIEKISALIRNSHFTDITVVPVKTKYPQGGERQLIKAVTDKQVPTGGIPPHIGVVVLNVATCAAIAEAVIEGLPLTHRVVTITGQAIANPGNFYVPIGIPVQDMIEFCGGLTEKGAKVVLGGPMMGIAIADLTTPIMKTTNAITVLTKHQIGQKKFKRQTTACIRCGRCLAVCPENLNPTKIAHAVKYGNFDLAKDYYINACMECGCCSYVCPANIEITGYIKTGKVYLARQEKLMP